MLVVDRNDAPARSRNLRVVNFQRPETGVGAVLIQIIYMSSLTSYQKASRMSGRSCQLNVSRAHEPSARRELRIDRCRSRGRRHALPCAGACRSAIPLEEMPDD
jgi:hypothetical protein